VRGVILAAAIAVIVAVAAVFGLIWRPSAGQPAARPTISTTAPPACERLVVPAYFEAPDWARAFRSTPPPSDMILDISGMGAGTAAQPDFRTAISEARGAGVTVLGYISTEDGQRALAEVEAEVRHYAAWYKVTSVFLDRVAASPARLGYYRAVADYVRSQDPGGQLWLNPGVYPDRAYMSLGGVVMTFEGTYAQYAGAAIPAWARDYPASRFAHTVYAASAADLQSTLRLAAARNAEHVYVTDGSGGNPYQALPGYWAAEDAAAAAGCGPAATASASGASAGAGGAG
jgi:hypothetical protein